MYYAVLLKGCRTKEALRADIANVWPITGMDFLVGGQMTVGGKGLVTDVAFERTHAGVDAVVCLQVVFELERDRFWDKNFDEQ